MIRPIYLLILLTTLAFTLTNCRKDDTTSSQVEGKQVNLGLKLDAHALEADPNAYPHETRILNLHVFIYTADGFLENPGNTKVVPANDGSLYDASGRLNGTWQVYEGQKQIYIVANTTEDNLMWKDYAGIESDLPPADILDHPTLEELQFLCLTAPFYYGVPTEEGGLMSGGSHVAITTSAHEVTIPLKRRYARVDLRLRKAPELADATVTIEFLDVSGPPMFGLIIDSDPEWVPVVQGAMGGKAYDPITGGQPTIGMDYTPVVASYGPGSIIPLYHLPRSKKDVQRSPTYIGFYAMVNGVAMSYNIYLAETAADGTQDLSRPMEIEGNKIYKVDATLTPYSFDVDIRIDNWDDQPVDGDIAGSTLSVSQSKVVMDWYNLGQRFDTGVDYVSDGKVSFVGYVIKNNDGTDISITTDGSNLPTWLPKENITNLPDGSTKNGRIGLEYVVTEALHPDVYLRLCVGSIIKDIRIVYDNGFVSNKILKTQGWTDSALPPIGVQYAKRGNQLPGSTASEDDKNLQWATNSQGASGVSTSTDFGSGMKNTKNMITHLNVDAPGAYDCFSMDNSSNLWYFPSREEMSALLKLATWIDSGKSSYLGPSYYFSYDDVWCSSRTQESNYYYMSFSGATFSAGATSFILTRCVRNM